MQENTAGQKQIFWTCHISYCKKTIPFSKALRLNKICSEKAFFDKRCNELELWLKEKGYRDKLVRGQLLKARIFLRSELLNKRKSIGNNNRFIFNITYHPVLLKLKNVLSEIHLLITPDRKHRKVFERIPIVRFRRAKILEDILVRAKVAPFEKKKDSSISFSTQREYWIKLDSLNCRSNNVVYLFSCKTSSK